jgi:hypothetical protein
MDHPFRVVIYNTLGWIALCRAMTEGISPSPEEAAIGRSRGSRPKRGRSPGRADPEGSNVVPFPRRRAPRRRRTSSGRRAQRKRLKAEILIFRPQAPA